MPYGETFDLENIEERRKRRLEARDDNSKELHRVIKKGEDEAWKYGFGAAGLLFLVAIIVYWFVSPITSLFVLIIAAVVHLHWIVRWVYQAVLVAQLNHFQDNLLAMELFDDLQEQIAKRDNRSGGEI
jgi:Flp pilus assembly protein TadB